MKNFLFILIISLLCFVSSPARSLFADVLADVFFTIPHNVKVGDTFEVLINADTLGETINSVNMSLDFDENLMSFAGYKDDNTVLKLWVDLPKDIDGKIYLSGIIPGGVSGLYDANKEGLGPIPLARLLFTATKEGDAKFSFIKTEILKHDGKGTALVVEQKNSEVVIRGFADSPAGGENVFDTNPPEPFTINFLESALFSRTPSMIVFEAQDADSGIKEYKMKTSIGGWKEVRSPQPITKNIFSRVITVRAFDFYGNFQDANLTIPGFLTFKYLLIILSVIVLSGALSLKLLKYRA